MIAGDRLIRILEKRTDSVSAGLPGGLVVFATTQQGCCPFDGSPGSGQAPLLGRQGVGRFARRRTGSHVVDALDGISGSGFAANPAAAARPDGQAKAFQCHVPQILGDGPELLDDLVSPGDRTRLAHYHPGSVRRGAPGHRHLDHRHLAGCHLRP